MLSILGFARELCDGISRRELMRVGGLLAVRRHDSARSAARSR